LAGYFVAGRLGNLAPVIWLALASLVFYAVSNWQFVALLLASIAFNYLIGLLLIARPLRPTLRFAVLTAGVAGDLAVLGYFKYAGFLAANLNAIFSTGLTLNILLPVGISFYTFTQIAFLCGLIIFAIGLFKKTCLADGIQPLVSLAFGPTAPTFDQAWLGALAYTFQLYFDFSGYSDMAIGISLMFGIFLPLNFNSPYKATSIIDFWRRWHMTLSQFLRDYLYIPLGGNRHGSVLRYLNLMITMLLGGLWHGAAWTFVIWGALHGAYLCINHAWSHYGPAVGPRFAGAANIAAFTLTFIAVVVAWVFFRADSLSTAFYVLGRMADPTTIAFGRLEIAQTVFIMVYAGIAWFGPNTQQIMGYDHKNRTVGQGLRAWQMRPLFIYATAAVLAFGILGIQQHSEFIYFRF
jgi:alginate O-acetyltransferase complex protein AlgI